MARIGIVSCVTARGVVFATSVLVGNLFLGGCNQAASEKQADPSQVPSAAPAGNSNPAAQSVPKPVDASSSTAISPAPTPPSTTSAITVGREIFLRHCAGCHGNDGNGKGIAAPFLFPRPRDFHSGKFRLVSSVNRVPSESSIDAVIRRGMPGSSMPPWPQFSESDRKALVVEVLRLYREGYKATYVQRIKEQEGADAEIDLEEISESVVRLTTATEESPAAEFGSSSPDNVARGRELYVKQGCVSCHGAQGKGDGQQRMVDDDGTPNLPRDLSRGIYKGGHDPASVYRRIALGMPGTPMPSSTNLTPEQIADLTIFLLSLSKEEDRQRAILNRQQIVARFAAALPPAESPTWDNTSATEVRMTPLWWRNDADPGLEVRAMHDGKSIAIHLRWHDAEPSRHAAKTEAFRDGAAVALSPSGQEPFLGMGGTGTAVDVWLWDADRQGPLVDVEAVYPRTTVDNYPLNESLVSSAEYDRPGTKTAQQPEVAFPARAAGNLFARRADQASGASSLVAAGPGSTTFRPPQSALVRAFGTWKGGQWTVVMTRTLPVRSPEEGLALTPGQQASLVFAIWDGNHRDRDGQKQISIWQELTLEKAP